MLLDAALGVWEEGEERRQHIVAFFQIKHLRNHLQSTVEPDLPGVGI